MILSVSTLIIGSGAATPVRVVNFCIAIELPNKTPGRSLTKRARLCNPHEIPTLTMGALNDYDLLAHRREKLPIQCTSADAFGTSLWLSCAVWRFPGALSRGRRSRATLTPIIAARSNV